MQTSFRFRESMLERLNKAARERVVSRNLIVERAIEEFLDKLDHQDSGSGSWNPARPTT